MIEWDKGFVGSIRSAVISVSSWLSFACSNGRNRFWLLWLANFFNQHWTWLKWFMHDLVSCEACYYSTEQEISCFQTCENGWKSVPLLKYNSFNRNRLWMELLTHDQSKGDNGSGLRTNGYRMSVETWGKRRSKWRSWQVCRKKRIKYQHRVGGRTCRESVSLRHWRSFVVTCSVFPSWNLSWILKQKKVGERNKLWLSGR